MQITQSDNNLNIHNYSPTWFLKALGNGGLSISFFMYLMFMIKHGTPIPSFSDISRELMSSSISSVLVAIDLAVILFYAFSFFRELIIQLILFKAFRQTPEYEALRCSNDEISLMAIPLSLAMGINVLFVLGSLFIPGLWSIIDSVLPFAILGFLVVGVYASKIFINYFLNTLAVGNFDYLNNRNLNQMIAPFAFIMVAVGLAAPAAMSNITAINILAFIAAVFFMTFAVLLMSLKLVLGFKSIFRYGIDSKSAPTLLIVIPIMTLAGITFVRLISGLYHHLIHKPIHPILFFVVLTVVLSIQVVFGILGYSLLKKNEYYHKFIYGKDFHVGSYSLICPGVAIFVIGMFFVHFGLIKSGFLDIFSVEYFILLLPLIVVQMKTIGTLRRINKKCPPTAIMSNI